MQVWKRRLVFLLAVGTGTLGLTLSSAGAQTPPDFPTFPTFPTFPDFPDFPSFPTTSPPPTMPPPTFPPFPTFPTLPPPPTMPPSTSPPTSSPPPTMPPTSSPPTSSPPTSVPSFEDQVNDIFDRLLEGLEDADATTRELLEEIRDEFFN